MREFDYEKAVNDYVRRRRRLMNLPGHRAIERPPLGVLAMQTEWWVAAGDEPVRVEEMDKDHCNNVIDFLWRRREEIFAQGWVFSIVETGKWQTNPNSWNLTMQKKGFDRLPLIAALRAQVEKMTPPSTLAPFEDVMCIRLFQPEKIQSHDFADNTQRYMLDGPHAQIYDTARPIWDQVREEVDWDGKHHDGEQAGVVLWVATTNVLTGETAMTFHPRHRRRTAMHFSAYDQDDQLL